MFEPSLSHDQPVERFTPSVWYGGTEVTVGLLAADRGGEAPGTLDGDRHVADLEAIQVSEVGRRGLRPMEIDCPRSEGSASPAPICADSTGSAGASARAPP
jgi:hypothetical protein